ncbi:MAG TPA: GntR family transcriptional regulator [Pseudolabrys sp.]|nr:GntR family transcriptional regulator [Pseudolabrys sp.]
MESLTAPKTLMDQAYAAILDAICNGTLKPGERLTQDAVAQRLNVSRQPIHNALRVLKAQGFVREAGRRGLSVAPLDPKLFEAIYQFRSAVEPLAVRLAAAHLNGEAVQRGRALVARGRSAAEKKDGKTLVAADMDFHSFIYELSDNALILETMKLNWHHLRRAMGEVLRLPGLAKRVWQEHAAILETIAAGDTGKAEHLMRDHVVSAHKDVIAALSAD